MNLARVVNRAECMGRAPSGHCAARGCPNKSRWSLTLDCGAVIAVCRLHANQGERTGRLTLAAPLPRQLDLEAAVRRARPDLDVIVIPRRKDGER